MIEELSQKESSHDDQKENSRRPASGTPISMRLAEASLASDPTSGRLDTVTTTVNSLTPLDTFDNPDLFINRELSWIEFDRKVLAMAINPDVPLLERVKFLAIFFNNLDEFFMVRVMNIQRQADANTRPTGVDRVPPAKQLAEIRRRVNLMVDEAEVLWLQVLKPTLQKKGIRFGKYQTLSVERKAVIDKYFDNEIFPILTPQAVDAGHPFPMISNSSINFVAELESLSTDAPLKTCYARLKCPNNVPRFLLLEKDRVTTPILDLDAHDGTIILIEDLIAARMDKLFPSFRIKAEGMFRITRNTDGEIEEDEADDLLSAVRDYVDQRRFGSVVRLELEQGMPKRLQNFLDKHLETRPQQIYKTKLPLSFSEFMQLGNFDRPELKYPTFKSRMPIAFRAENEMFADLKKADQLFFHPFESFGTVLQFIDRAAKDPQVAAIKQTLYRCGSNSPIVKSLLEARRRGKQVTAVVELKARFDEERNINWAEELEKAGVNVVYGFAGLKIHAKVCLVVRREKKGLKRYVHIGTGNYNAGTAKIYTDLGLVTANREICDDVQDLFNVMTGCGIVDRYRRLLVSPKGLRPNLVRLIEEEIATHRENGNGHIILKCNQLVDDDIIRRLYQASCVGVRIECIVRGICCLRPGIPGISENITVRSLVGRFLEHARIYYFAHGGKPQMLIGSADLMPRNLNGRIEVLVPILEKPLVRNVLRQILSPQLADNTDAWILQSDGSYVKASSSRDDDTPAVHAESVITDSLDLLRPALSV